MTEQLDHSQPSHGGSVDCAEAVHQLYSFLDGELTDDKRTAIANHLDLCAPCAGAAHFETELRHVIADHCAEKVPDDLRARILAAIASGANPS
jgi:mycothiol system anti-sigma-R factor